MQDDPYEVLADTVRSLAREHTAPGWRTGKVTKLTPLAVDCGGLSLTGAELQIDARLRGTLLPGDRVAMLSSADDTAYIILCKVVNT